MPKGLLGGWNVKSLPHVNLRVGQSIGLLNGLHSGVVLIFFLLLLCRWDCWNDLLELIEAG